VKSGSQLGRQSHVDPRECDGPQFSTVHIVLSPSHIGGAVDVLCAADLASILDGAATDTEPMSASCDIA
jgi:hypothetical protein